MSVILLIVCSLLRLGPSDTDEWFEKKFFFFKSVVKKSPGAGQKPNSL